jgi:hypothetical protein
LFNLLGWESICAFFIFQLCDHHQQSELSCG